MIEEVNSHCVCGRLSPAELLIFVFSGGKIVGFIKLPFLM